MKYSIISIFIVSIVLTPIAWAFDNAFADAGHRSFLSWYGLISMSSLGGVVSSKIFEFFNKNKG